MTAHELAQLTQDVAALTAVSKRVEERSLKNQEEIVKLRVFQGRATVIFTVLAAVGTGTLGILLKFVYDIATKVLGT